LIIPAFVRLGRGLEGRLSKIEHCHGAPIRRETFSFPVTPPDRFAGDRLQAGAQGQIFSTGSFEW
jgi:hypothetical protein